LIRAALLGAVLPSLCLAQSTAAAGDAKPDRIAQAGSLLSLSETALGQGDYQRAADRARESADIYRSLGDALGRTRAVKAAGLADLYSGAYPAALASFEEALALARATGDRDAEVEELNNVGNVHYYQARYLDALHAFQNALDEVDKAGPAAWTARRRRITISNLAVLFQRVGREEQAIDLYGQLRRSPASLAPSEQGRLLTNLGVLYRRLEDPVKALETYGAARDLFAKERHSDGEIGVLKNIGIVRARDLADLDGAVDSFTSALALAERSKNRRETMQARLYLGEAYDGKDDLVAARREFEAALGIAKELGTIEEQWKALYGLARVERKSGHDEAATGRLREAIAGIESVRGKLQLSFKTDFLADKGDVYDALVELRSPGGDPAEIFDLLERSRARTFQDRLEERSGKPAIPPSLAAVRAKLDAGTLLVEFWLTRRSALALWVTRDGAGIAPLADPDAALAALSTLLDDLGTASGTAWTRSAEILGKLLLPASVPFGDDRYRHLVIVPDGPLASLPFEVLPHPGGGGPLLIERYDVSYLPSAALLLRPPASATSWRLPWTRELLAFGDPVIAQERAGPLVAGDLPGRLPTSAQEVRSIARMTHGRAELYLGAANLKKHLLEGRAAGVPLLHFSTHATADDINPERSRIVFSPDVPKDPLDFLFLKEVYDLDLRGVDLATLSACDTERGKNIRREGLQGFSRALLSAGSRSAITALWRVGDQPTTELMKQLYFELNRGETKAEALRLAKLKFLHSGGALAHPRHWAAFVLNGDGQNPIPRVFSWSSVLVFAASALVFAVATVGQRRHGRRRSPASAL
jgi:CHAT domain-containing protein/tetratricopeptide (TPR) repeat protein